MHLSRPLRYNLKPEYLECLRGPCVKRRRRILMILGGLAVVLAGAWFSIREIAYTNRLPQSVKSYMPAHWRIPWGLKSDLRDAIEDLYSPYPVVRSAAVERLGDMGEDAAPAAPFLVPLLADASPSQAAYAGESGDETSLVGRVMALMNQLFPPPGPKWTVIPLDYDPPLGEKAAAAAADLGEAAVDPLIALLSDPSKHVRRRAVVCLGIIGDPPSSRQAGTTAGEGPRAVEPIIALLQKEESWEVRDSASLALGLLGDKQAVDALIVGLGRGSWDGFNNAAEALGRIGDERAVGPIMERLDQLKPEVACAALVRLGEPGLRRLVGEPRTADLHITADAIATAIRRAGLADDPRTIAVLTERAWQADAVATDEIADERLLCQDILILLHRPEMFEPMLRQLTDPNAFRPYAARSLGLIGDVRAVPALVAAAEGTDEAVADAALEALGRIPCDASLAAILRAADRDKVVPVDLLNHIFWDRDHPPHGGYREWRRGFPTYDRFKEFVEDIGKPAAGPLTAALASGKDSLRRIAADMLNEALQVADTTTVDYRNEAVDPAITLLAMKDPAPSTGSGRPEQGRMAASRQALAANWLQMDTGRRYRVISSVAWREREQPGAWLEDLMFLMKLEPERLNRMAAIEAVWNEPVSVYQGGGPPQTPKEIERAERAAAAYAARAAKEDRSRTIRLLAALYLQGYSPDRDWEAVRTSWISSGELPHPGMDFF
jgi:HEAT repeat protein